MCFHNKVTEVCIHCGETLDISYKLKLACRRVGACWTRRIVYDFTSEVSCGCRDWTK